MVESFDNYILRDVINSSANCTNETYILRKLKISEQNNWIGINSNSYSVVNYTICLLIVSQYTQHVKYLLTYVLRCVVSNQSNLWATAMNPIDKSVTRCVHRNQSCVLCYEPVSRAGVTNVIQWSLSYSGWDVLLTEVQLLLNQVAYGAGKRYSILILLFVFLTRYFLIWRVISSSGVLVLRCTKPNTACFELRSTYKP